MTRKIIIDTDPGQDDAVAILLALAAPELTLLGITCVAGNVPLPLTHVNARRVCELAGRADIPVYAGCDAPLVRKLVTAEHVHGKTGLDGVDLPAPTLPLAEGPRGRFPDRHAAPRSARHRHARAHRPADQYRHGDAARPPTSSRAFSRSC